MSELPHTGPATLPPSPLRGGTEGGGGPVDRRSPPTPHLAPRGGGEPADALFCNARHLRTKNIARARQLRTGATVPERHMWQLLRTFNAHHFRRQVPIGSYVVDFASHRARLIIELDGETHFTVEAMARDQHRTDWLNAAGYRVLRFTNSEIVTNPDGVWSVIDQWTTAPPPPSVPPLKGEGGEGAATSSVAREA